jgi:hypothetical protein
MAELPDILQRTSAQWSTIDPFLPKGMLAIESDTGRKKCGTGLRYSDTSYVPDETNVTSLQAALDQKVSSALPWASTHTSANGTQYNIGDLVYSGGNIYRAIATNDSIAVGNTSYWALVGAGYRLNIDLQTGLSTKVSSITTGITGADQVTNIVSLTQAEYDALPTKSATTLYIING